MLPEYFVLITFALIPIVSANKFCPDIHRCPGHHKVALEYERKSECVDKGDGWLDCSAAAQRCVCLNTQEVCKKVWHYTSQTPAVAPQSLEASTPSGPSSEQCSNSYPGDGGPCNDHNMCKPVPGGVAICCATSSNPSSSKCVHVHNVPCVRDFFDPIDQLCSDAQWKSIFG